MTWKALFAAFVVLSMVASPALSQAPPDSEKAKQVVALVGRRHLSVRWRHEGDGIAQCGVSQS